MILNYTKTDVSDEFTHNVDVEFMDKNQNCIKININIFLHKEIEIGDKILLNYKSENPYKILFVGNEKDYRAGLIVAIIGGMSLIIISQTRLMDK